MANFLSRCHSSANYRLTDTRRPRPASFRPGLSRCFTRKACVSVRAELQDPIRNVQAAVDSFLRRHDILSTGMGALIVTSYCVYAHGQDPFTALGITFTATVIALVMNEVLFSDNH